jgi:hypothetical protein
MKPSYLLAGFLFVICCGFLGTAVFKIFIGFGSQKLRNQESHPNLHAHERSVSNQPIQTETQPLKSTAWHLNLGIYENLLISYLIDLSMEESRPSYNQCMSNLNFFLQYGFEDIDNVHYNFIVVGNQIPESLTSFKHSHGNIEILHKLRLNNSDLSLHANGLQLHINHTDLYFLTSCTALGPFYHYQAPIVSTDTAAAESPRIPLIWISLFLSSLKQEVKLVGPTIRCDPSPHVQDYAMLFERTAASIFLTEHHHQVLDDVSFSKALLAHGYNIASLDARHQHKDFRKLDVCDTEFRHLRHSKYQDPTTCYDRGSLYNIDSPGCRGLEPCLVVFVKVGAHVADQQLLPAFTSKRIQAEANNLLKADQARMCTTTVSKARPFWNIDELYQVMVRDQVSIATNHSSDTAIIIRAHAGYSSQLLSFLWMLEGISEARTHSILAIIVPTEKGSMEILKKLLAISFTPFQSKVTAVPFDVPDKLIDQYSPYLETLCSEKWKHEMISTKQHSAHDVSRHCEVNSPLHYLLVDIALHYLKKSCASCRRLIVTNADNYYSPKFFSAIASSTNDNVDVLMTNMITRGYVFPVKPEKGKIDLGAYSVSFDFIRRTGSSFLTSIPSHPQANDYHDADGHFLVNLLRYGARTSLLDEYLFYHI